MNEIPREDEYKLKKKKLLIIGLTLFVGMNVPVTSKAEDQTNEQLTSSEPSNNTMMNEATTVTSESTNADLTNKNDDQTNSNDFQSVVAESSQSGEETAQPTTAVVNGEVVELDPPQKSGQGEAATTTPPKEELIQPRAYTAKAASIALYRLYNPNSGEHFYTKTTAERDHLRKVGWRYEGIGWQSPTNGSAVYRLYNKNSGEHFYSATRFA